MGHLLFACVHSLKVLPVCCGSVSYDVVTALTHCKSVRIYSPRVRVVWADLSWKLKASATASIHFIYSCRPGQRSRCLLNQRTGRRPLRSALFPIYWVPRQVSVWPVGAVCVRPSSGLALGHRALFHILYDVHMSVYSRLLPFSLWTIFESSPFFISSLFFSQPPFLRQAVVAFILMCVVVFVLFFFFSHKVLCNLKKLFSMCVIFYVSLIRSL